jgi:hypothetical protein
VTRAAASAAPKPRWRLPAWLFVFVAPPLAMSLLARAAVAVGWTGVVVPLLLASLAVGGVVLHALLRERSPAVRIGALLAYGAAMWLPTLLLGVYGTCVFTRCA